MCDMGMENNLRTQVTGLGYGCEGLARGAVQQGREAAAGVQEEEVKSAAEVYAPLYRKERDGSHLRRGVCPPWRCKRLEEVRLLDSVREIGKYAFSGCSRLRTMTIGNNVTMIGDYAFQDCSGLMELNFNSTACPSVRLNKNIICNKRNLAKKHP